MVSFDVEKIREDFPTLNQQVNGKTLVYLDNAATTHKPKYVLNAIKDYYEKYNANPNRGAHYLGVSATEFYESSREKVRQFINAKSAREIIFTRNATEALNLIAYSYGLKYIEEGDEIVVLI